MIDERVPPHRRLALERLQVDWRNAYFGPADTADAWCAYPARAAQAAQVAPIAPTASALVTSPLEPMRSRPAHAAEQVSELRMGELVQLLREQDGWWLVGGEDEYVGWVRGWTLQALAVGRLDDLRERVVGRYGGVLGALPRGEEEGGVPVALGTPLLRPRGARHDDSMVECVELPDGSTGRLAQALIARQAPTGQALEAVQMARRLVGAAYKWGGRSPSGLDCSGLVQLCFLLAGFSLPRDAAQQARRGSSVALAQEQWRAGDLLCFGDPVDHVGIWDGGGMVHARGRVRRNLPSEVPELLERLRTVRRLGPADHVSAPTLWARLPLPPRA